MGKRLYTITYSVKINGGRRFSNSIVGTMNDFERDFSNYFKIAKKNGATGIDYKKDDISSFIKALNACMKVTNAVLKEDYFKEHVNIRKTWAV